jgi:hypothetical protein
MVLLIAFFNIADGKAKDSELSVVGIPYLLLFHLEYPARFKDLIAVTEEHCFLACDAMYCVTYLLTFWGMCCFHYQSIRISHGEKFGKTYVLLPCPYIIPRFCSMAYSILKT